MANRNRTLKQIAQFLEGRLSNYEAILRHLDTLTFEQRDSIVRQPNYTSSIQYEFTTKELSEELSLALSYHSIYYALQNSNLAEIKNKRQPADLARIGIYTEFTSPPTFSYKPSLMHSIPKPPAPVVITEVRPEFIEKRVDVPIVQEKLVDRECTRKHFNYYQDKTSYSLDALITMAANRLGFNDGALTNNSVKEPIVALAFLSKKEVDILRAAIGFDYKVYEPIKEQTPA